MTYSLTEIHQDHIVDSSGLARLEALGVPTGPGGTATLTDRTDDFDFVLADDHGLTFRALDRQPRTDTWLSNEREVVEGIDPWDPDHDDDGLTDGQELKWVTERTFLGTISKDLTTGMEPRLADTDGDGWWGGWIGVYWGWASGYGHCR